MTGVKSRRPPREILREALDKIASLPSGSRRVGLSPHAPYSTSPALLRLSAQVARRHRLRLVVHVAESEQEMEMFMNGSGKMHLWLARNGRDMSDCGIGSPVQHLERQGLLSRNLMAVHVNYLAPGDAELLAKRKVSVCHCPRSHAYFKHHAFPLSEFAAAGVNICLGTDSLASVHAPRKEPLELNMFTEMHEIASAHPTLTPETILRMATVNGALALGMKNRVGELSAKSLADMIAIPHAGKIGDSASAAVHHRGDVFASMIGGNWVIAPGQKPAETATALAT
jgi:cytosine/adenosine deaminase-related metal-dependent hydrolase